MASWRLLILPLLLLATPAWAQAPEHKPTAKEVVDGAIEKLKAKGGFAAHILFEDEDPPKELRRKELDAVYASPDLFQMPLPCAEAQTNPLMIVNGGRAVVKAPLTEEWITGGKLGQLQVPLDIMSFLIPRARPHAVLERMQKLSASASFRADEAVSDVDCKSVEVVLLRETEQIQWLWEDRLNLLKLIHKGKLDTARLDVEKCQTTYIVSAGKEEGLPRRIQLTTKLAVLPQGKGGKGFSDTRTCTYDLSHFGENQKVEPPDEAKKLLGMK